LFIDDTSSVQMRIPYPSPNTPEKIIGTVASSAMITTRRDSALSYLSSAPVPRHVSHGSPMCLNHDLRLNMWSTRILRPVRSALNFEAAYTYRTGRRARPMHRVSSKGAGTLVLSLLLALRVAARACRISCARSDPSRYPSTCPRTSPEMQGPFAKY
jgi:hypothetical protein